jgi:hypothetical protein
MKTQTTQTTKPNASVNNTPVVATFASYIAKVTDKKQADALKAVHKTAQAKKAEKSQAKGGVFALLAGTVAKIEHKHLKKAIAYHVSKGNLAKTTAGIKLTEQGAMLWNAERVAADPEKFQAIAAMLHGKGATIPEWSKQPTAQVNAEMPFPNMLYWGSFSTGIMRQAFAAIFAK